jgi:CysZ protein
VDSAKVRTAATRAATPAKDFFLGLRLLGRGIAIYGRSPGLVLLGLIPALLAFLVLAAAVGTLIYFIQDAAATVTWFADDWSSGVRGATRLLAGLGLVGVSLLVSVLLFTGLTLTIGEPFYEKISEKVDDRLGGLPNAVDLPWWKDIARSAADGIRLALVSALIGIPLFAAGFLPIIGQTVVPVVGALVGGWFLTVELTGVAFARRGMSRLRVRRPLLQQRRWLAVGLGAGVFVCFLIPLGAVLIMPAAVAGGTLLTRELMGEPSARS